MRSKLLLAMALTVGSLGFGVPAASAGGDGDGGDGANGHFTCEATSARVKTPLVDAVSTQANPGGDPCQDQFAQVLGAAVPGAPQMPVVTANVLTAQTESDPGDEPGAQSDAEAVDVKVFLGTTTINLEVLRAQAIARCDNGEEVLEGNSEVIGLDINGQGGSFDEEVKITDPANPLLNIYLNEQTETTDAEGNRVLTQRALHIFGLQSNGFLVDIVVAEAVVDVHGDPCAPEEPPKKPECSDEIDNDKDGKIDFPADPGCESPEDDDESDDPKAPECSDGMDNDGDKLTDHPEDPGCESPEDNNESDEKK
jgi:hypothetical protein